MYTPGVNYIIRGDRFRVRITDRTKYIWAGFRCLNPQCHSGSEDEPYPGYRPDLNEVLPAPNFLPGLVLKQQKKELIRRTGGGVGSRSRLSTINLQGRG